MRSLALFGDSLLGQFQKPRIERLERQLNEPTIVFNCAVGGFTSADGARQAPTIALLQADITVLSFGANDCAPWKQVPLEQFERNIRSILSSFSNSDVFVFLPPAIIEQTTDSDGYRTNAELDRYRRSLRTSVESDRVIDTDLALQRSSLRRTQIHKPDGLHLTDEAYECLIDELAGVINRSATSTDRPSMERPPSI